MKIETIGHIFSAFHTFTVSDHAMKAIIGDARNKLIQSSDEHTIQTSKHFFREEIRSYGVKIPEVNRIARSYLPDLQLLSKQMVFDLCSMLWESGYLEESFIACDWAYSRRNAFEPGDLDVFREWIINYVNNWASCDTLCNHSMGTLLEMYPENVQQLKFWTSSGNRWMRRAAAVSLIIPARKGLFLDDILEIADLLLEDRDDLVQKGYGWMLKACSQAYQQEVFDFVMNRRNRMPRTALRYAIEKMPTGLRKLAMER